MFHIKIMNLDTDEIVEDVDTDCIVAAINKTGTRGICCLTVTDCDMEVILNTLSGALEICTKTLDAALRATNPSDDDDEVVS